MKKIKFTLLALFIGSIGFAQDYSLENQESTIKHKIGMAFNTTAGVGLSYKLNYKRNAFQISALPVGGKQRMYFIPGASYERRLTNNDVMNFNVQAAASLFRKRAEVVIYDEVTYEYKDAIENVYDLNAGLGISADVQASESIEISFNVGYAVYDIAGSWRTYPSTGFSLYLTLGSN